MYVEGEGGRIDVTFAYYIFAGDRENKSLKGEKYQIGFRLLSFLLI